MAQHRPTAVGLALVFFVLINSIQAIDKCKSGCGGASGPLKLTQGTTYKYDYNGKINITLSTAEGQGTTTEVKATVLLTQQADCNQLLRLQNVQIIGPDGKRRTGISNIEKPVVLNNNNGALSEFICTEDGDTQDSLNLKRAIASFFQVNQEKNSEIDVFGQCPTQISHFQDGDVVTITKSKNLNRCAFRESLAQNYITSTLNIQSEIRSSPILNSNMDSKQKIKNGVLDSANIVENYLFVPFSVGNHGAKATIESKILLTGTSKDNPSTKCQIPKSIIFENPHLVNTKKSNINIILKNIKETSENIEVNVGEQTAVQFIELIKLLRVSKKADVLSVYNQIRSGSGFSDREGAKKIFLDAILLASNGDSIEVTVELLKNKELSPFEEKQFYLSLSRVRHPTIGSIETATDLLNRAKLPREAYLGVGALAGRYCSIHNCDNIEVIDKLIQKLLSKLGDFKAANRKEESDMIYILKGLTNIGYLNDAILSKLITLVEDKKQSIRLRIAALDTFHSAPCKNNFRNSALKTLKDIQQDSEIRIKAYLFLTICPNANIGNAIQVLLEKEKSNQVGGYISSHIKNLRSSTNPDKLLAKTHLGFIHTPTRFKIDPRKYSLNGEFSYNVNALGLGSNIEGNIIYSQNSWLPRSTNLNLTAEVFGQRFNFLEILARQENLDRIIEHYLGPQGILRKATLQQNWDSAVKPIGKLWNNLRDKIDKSLRARRDISKSEIDAINKKVSIRTNYLDRNLDLDLSIKTFGSEVLFMNSFDTTEHVSLQNIIDNLVAKLNQGLDTLKNFENTLRSNLLLMDAELAYPTSLGFPLRLTLDAASNIQLKTSGSIDIRELVTDKEDKDLNLKISLIPSATVTVTGKFSLDTPLLENGLRVTSTLHTSTGGELLVNSFKKGYGLEVKFKIPVQKQELINLKHDIIFQTRENGVSIKDQRLKFTQNKDFSICIDQLMSFIGLEFCADFYGPNLSGKKVPILPFPLSGDAKAVITIERGDIDTFHYRSEIFTKNDGKIGVEATIETLGPNNKKGVGLKVEGYISPDKYVKATLNSPIKNAEAEARLICNDDEKLIALSLKDQDKLYSAKAGLKVDNQGDKSIFKPILEYTTPENNSPQTPPFHVEGKVIRENNGDNVKFIIDNVKLVIPNKKSVTLKGNFGIEGPAYYTDVTLTDGDISGSLKGRLQVQHNLLKVHTEFENTFNPKLNLNIRGEFKREGTIEFISSNLQIIHGPDLKSKKNVITLINVFSLKNPKEMELSIKNKFSYPVMKISTKFDFERKPKSLSYDVSLHYGEAKLGSDLKVITNSKAQGDYHLELGIESMKNKIEVKSSRQVLGHHDSKLSNSISINGKKLEVHGKVKHYVRISDINIAADLIIKTPNSKTPIKLNKGLKINSREFDFHVKLLSGNNPLIDTTLKSNRVGNINGHMKVNIKEVLIVNGQIKAQNGVGSGNIVIEAKSLKRTAKAETTFTIQDPTFNVDVTLYPMFNEDKNKKVILSTKNKLLNSDLESASTLDVFGSKSLLKLKAHIGSMTSGKTTVDADLTLPEGQFLSAKVNRDITPKGKLWNSDTVISLEHRNDRNTAGRKLTIKEISKDTVLGEGIFDITLSITGDDSAGHNINIDGNVKRQRNGVQWEASVYNKITGSFLEHPIETNYKAVFNKCAGNLNLKASFCPKSEIELEGKYDFEGKDAPISADVNIALKLPFETLSNLKTSESFSFVKGQEGTQASLSVSSSLATSSSIPNLNIDTKSNFKVQGHKKVGNAMYHVEINSPIKTVSDVSAGFNIDSVKKESSIMGDFKSVLPNNQIFQVGGSLMAIGPKEFKAEGSLELPTQSFKSNKFYLHSKRADDIVTSQAKLTSDGKTYDLDTNLNLNSKEPSLNIKLTWPNGKITQITANAKRPSNSKFEANFKHICQVYDYLLEASLDVNSESLNDFNVKMTANSPNLNIKDIIVKIGNAGSSDGKTINVEITSEGKNVVAGRVTISSREENDKYIIQGSGNFKVENRDTSGNFKYIRTSLLSTEKNGESGEILSFDGSLGNKAIDAEIKLTNKEFRYSNSYCEESKQCAHIEIGILNTINNSEFHNEIEVSIDLRKLGVPNEFGFKAVTRTQNYLLDHTVDIHFENAANKYQYTLFIRPKEFGISFTTPNRIISLEAKAEIPTNGLHNGGKVSGEVAFYTDKKNNPNSKSLLKGLLDIDLQNHLTNGELNLNIVGQNKPYIIKYTEHLPSMNLKADGSRQLILDIFAKPDQKIVIDHKYSSQIFKDTFKVLAEETIDIESQGWGIDINVKETTSLDPKALTWAYEDSASVNIGGKKYDSIIKLALSTKEGYILIKHLNQVILEAKSDINLQKGQVKIDTHTSGLGITPYDTIFEVKNYNSLKLTQYQKDNPNTKLFVSAEVIPKQKADLRAEHIVDGNKRELFHASLKLDEKNFLQPDTAFNSKNIEAFIAKVKEIIFKHLETLSITMRDSNQKVVNDCQKLSQKAKEAIPDSSKTLQFYESELSKFKDELAADKTLQNAAEFVKNLINTLSIMTARIINNISDFVEKIAISLSNAFSDILKTIHEEILPKLKEIADKIISVVESISNKLFEVLLAYIAKVGLIIEHIQPQLKAIATSFSEISEDIVRFIYKTVEGLKNAIAEQIQHILNQLKASSVIDNLKSEYKNLIKDVLPSEEVIVNTIRAMAGIINEVILIPEFQNVINLIEQYLEKKITQKPVDDIAELEKIVRTLSNGVAEFVLQLSKELVPDFARNLKIPSFNLDLLRKFPSSFGDVRVSLWEYFIQEDVNPIFKYLVTLPTLPHHFSIPPSLIGIVVGAEVYTFDQDVFYFPGTCSYLLARDAVNGNFSIIASFENNQLAGVTFSDRSGIITITKDKILLNHAEANLPIVKGGLRAYRFYSRYSIISSAGVVLDIELNLSGCAVTVSGFYHGQLRGLFGNGNHESYDDLTLPNGRICNSLSELGQAYSIGPATKCTPVKVAQGPSKPNPKCDKIFDWDSPFRLCYPFVNHETIKKGCELSAASGNERAYWTSSITYNYYCWKSNIPVKLPTDINLQCENSLVPHNVDDRFNVKINGKSADVLLLMSSNKINELLYKNFVQPLLSNIVKEFAAKGIDDVEFHILLYGGQYEYPGHVTVNGKLTFKGEAPVLHFSDGPKPQKLKTGWVDLDKIISFFTHLIYEVKWGLGFSLSSESFADAMQYPFRAEARRSVVVVSNDPCEVDNLPLHITKSILLTRKDISLSVISPVQSLRVKDLKTTKDVIGFDSEKVITLSDAKTHPTGSPTLQKDLYFNDLCLDYTLSIGGKVYPADNMFANQNSKSEILPVIAQNIVADAVSKDIELDCVCETSYRNPFAPINVCTVIDTKEK